MTENSCKCNRWAVNINDAFKLEKLEDLFKKAVQCIPEEEYKKIPTLRHREDALAYLIGRLFYRYATMKCSDATWSSIVLDRTPQGKPFLVQPANTTFALNVSHQGEYVAMATSCSSLVGVDIMRLDKQRNNKTADEYITEMAGSASPEELRMMRSQPTEAMKMTMFYRYWCLKEAICKATGEGILDDLKRLDFRVHMADKYKPGCFVTSTTVLLDNNVQQQWVFEETFIDPNHSVAVCKEKKCPRSCIFKQDPEAKIFFSKIPFTTLVEAADKLNMMPDNGTAAYEEFAAKPRRAF